jgi:hypothetical protein
MAIFVVGGVILLLTMAQGVLTTRLDYVDFDKRTTRFRQVRTALFVCILMVFFAGCAALVLSWLDKSDSDKTAEDLRHQVDKISEKATGLEAKLAEMNGLLAPFVALALERHANLTEHDALAALRSDFETKLADLTKTVNAAIARRQITYDDEVVVVPKLKQLAGCELQIVFTTGEPDGAEFADELKWLFGEGGWSVAGPSALITNGPLLGLTLMMRKDAVTCGEVAAAALRRFDPELSVTQVDGGPTSLRVTIGGHRHQ